ncbi:MAG TPA: hypothetical protein VLD59_15455 [Steroidobacteraceae bacterium]|nr:hypothetical protein [Steroidobacteraceae bacterium]
MKELSSAAERWQEHMTNQVVARPGSRSPWSSGKRYLSSPRESSPKEGVSLRSVISDTTSSRALIVDIQKAMKNPGIVFGTPEVLDASTELSAQQKRAILLQWKDQLQQLLIADEESMLAAGASTGANADCLRRVTDTLTRINAGLS